MANKCVRRVGSNSQAVVAEFVKGARTDRCVMLRQSVIPVFIIIRVIIVTGRVPFSIFREDNMWKSIPFMIGKWTKAEARKARSHDKTDDIVV